MTTPFRDRGGAALQSDVRSITQATPSFINPLPEQEDALELFLREEGLRIDAYAGAGKTTTLQLLAQSTTKRGLYLAFNRSIANEAQARFPARVRCSTAHSIAYRQVRRQFNYSDEKMTGAITPNIIADAFRFPTCISFSCGVVLERLSYAAVLRDALNQFLRSEEETPQASMIPCYGRLELLDPPQFASFASQALGHVSILWNAMRHKSAGPPLGHDGYLKLWALAKPAADADYLMVDEAQDLNPVLLSVVRNLHAPIIFVGDPYQQIYQWRGAVNAMDAIPSRHQAFLTKSFRFGREIAAAATIILKTLGATRQLVGSPAIESRIARVKPDAILARSNVGVMTNVLACLRRNVPCAVLGGTQELERLLGDVQRIKQKLPAQRPELLGFDTWKEVMSASVQPEGDHLRALVNLVQEHGESQILSALSRCQPTEETAQVICSTGHRAKGREWNRVHLDRDFEAGFAGAAKLEDRAAYEAEARLLYVAVTRTKRALHLPREISKRFGIQETRDEVPELGVPSP